MMRDFVWVDDVLDIVEDNGAPSGIYDIGSGHTISFREVSQKSLQKIRGGDPRDPLPRTFKR